MTRPQVGTPIRPPKYWQKLQTMCLDLWSEILDDPNTQENGRVGQAQAAVDVVAYSKSLTGYIGIQCKRKDDLAGTTLTINELRDEVKKAKSFKPQLKQFIVAFTGQRDKDLQEEARRITEKHRKNGLFEVHVWAWEDIETELFNYPHVIEKHFAD